MSAGSILAGSPGAAPVKVSLVWGPERVMRQTVEVTGLGRDYRTFPFSFRAGASTENARLEIVSSGRGSFEVGAVSVMPAANIDGFRPEVLALLKELDAPVYRWPGGNFVSGYDWRDGLGDRDRRPPRKNPAWQGVEHNDVGIHEYMDLMRILGADPYITVNSGLGDVKMAVDEVRVRQRRRPIRRWAGSGRRTAIPSPGASSSGRSATRCTAAGSSATCRSPTTSESTSSSPWP